MSAAYRCRVTYTESISKLCATFLASGSYLPCLTGTQKNRRKRQGSVPGNIARQQHRLIIASAADPAACRRHRHNKFGISRDQRSHQRGSWPDGCPGTAEFETGH
jgi:hypothetical protein